MIDENTPYNQFAHMSLAELRELLNATVQAGYKEDMGFIKELSEEIHRRQLAVPANE